jgi:ABC-2 type transport system ATP-binding protein
MRRRLDLAAGLVGRPSVIFLDEPTTGLDLLGRQAIYEIVAELAASGVAVLLTTQYLEEADQLADRVAVLNHGRIIADGTAAELKSRVSRRRLDLTAADGPAYQQIVRRVGERAVLADPARRVVGVPTDGTAAHIRAVLDDVDPDRHAVSDFATHTATLDDVFLTLTGRVTPDAIGNGDDIATDQKETAHV